MIFTKIKDEKRNEEIIAYYHEENDIIRQIEKLCSNEISLIGYFEDEIIKLELDKIECFITYDNKTYAYVGNKEYVVKARLYQLEENLPDSFIKINKSCIANINRIKNFKATIGGSLMVVFKNNYQDYVSRRELKNVKTRMGL